jgi:hypothetical protein
MARTFVPATIMTIADAALDMPAFKIVCVECGSLTIKIDNPDRAPPTTIISCARCDAPRGTVEQLHALARSGSPDVFEF